MWKPWYAWKRQLISRSRSARGSWEGTPTPADARQPPPTIEVVRAWCVSQLAEFLQVAPETLDIHTPFADYGLGSMHMVRLSGALEDWLGMRLSPTLLYDYPTIEALTQHLAVGMQSTAGQAVTSTGRMSAPEPVAIVGLGCRFPAAQNPTAFWQLLRHGVDAITEVPAERWDVEAFYDPQASTPGKMTTRWGGFLDRVDQFDASFFGIPPRTAISMDPQQRLLLEVAWEALEDAVQPPERLAGTKTGVFIGISTDDYGRLLTRDPGRIDAYTGTGGSYSIAANRLSFLFDLRGPSLAIDTACSSALVAIHLACQSLREGESDLALAGGVNLILSPELTIALSQAQMLSPDGRCKSFDRRANGYSRSEGAGVVVLKPLAAALADNDRIYAVIRGSAVTQDGKSNGLTAPSQEAQEATLRAACKQAGITPGDIDYIEAHGTGTALGDPVEAKALGNVLASGRPPDRPCRIGTVKTNIGHIEAAAGIAGLIKTALSLHHRTIPPSLHFQDPNPLIPFDRLPLRVAQVLEPWPEKSGPALAGVSAFGFGGTNAHVILEATSPRPANETHTRVERPLHLLSLSAKSPTALQALARRYVEYLASDAAEALADVCFSANAGRSHHAHRLAAVAASASHMRDRLASCMAGQHSAGLWCGHVHATTRPKVAFLFTGQGAQYGGMGRQLYETQPTFRAVLERCNDILLPYLDEPLLSVLFPDAGDAALLDETAYTQPALFALEYALAELWRTWGVEPDVVLGYSVGEYVAACVAGACGLEDGLRLVAERGRLMQALPPHGAMAAVFADAGRVAESLESSAEHVSIAAINGPHHTTISGRRDAVQAAVRSLTAEGIRSEYVRVSHAFHSALMEPMLDAFEQAARRVPFAALRMPLVANLTGQVQEPGTVLEASYWRRHIRSPIRFAESIQTLAAPGDALFVEVGPHPTVSSLAKRCLPPEAGTWLPSLEQGRDDWRCLLESLGRLYTHGVRVNWQGFDQDYARARVSLPTYPFERQRYWIEPGEVERVPQTSQRQPGHPLLGRRLRSTLSTIQFEAALHLPAIPSMADHCLQGAVVLPATAYVEMALAAARQAFGVDEPPMLANLTFHAPLFLAEEAARTIQLIVAPVTAGETDFRLASLATDQESQQEAWTLHASGTMRFGHGHTPPPEPVRLADLEARCVHDLPPPRFYQVLQAAGLAYGARFQGVQRLKWRPGEAIGRVRLPSGLEAESTAYWMHPALLDSCLQVLAATVFAAGGETSMDVCYLPAGVASLRLYDRPGDTLWSHATLRSEPQPETQAIEGDVRLLDETGRVVAEVQGLRLEQLGRPRHGSASDSWQPGLYTLRWRPSAPAQVKYDLGYEPAEPPGSWLIFMDAAGTGQRLAELLTSHGETCLCVFPGAAYEVVDPWHFRLNPTEPAAFQRLMSEVLRPDRPPCRGVIHLWSLDAVPTDETTPATLRTAQEQGCHTVLLLLRTLSQTRLPEPFRLYLVTRGAQAVGALDAPVAPAQAPLWGLGRVVMQEYPGLRGRLVDLDPTNQSEAASALLRECASQDHEAQVAWRGSLRYVPRLTPYALAGAEMRDADDAATARLQLPVGASFQLDIRRPGRLQTLHLRPTRRREPPPGQVEIRVHAAGVNFRDVMHAMGVYPGTPIPFGAECAGTVSAVGADTEGWRVGDDVIAVAPGSFGPYTITSADLVVPKPVHLSFEEAATIPIAFVTAHYALTYLARMRQGERVLIHAAAGGVGLAAVQLAQRVGAEIFATAGSPEKRAFLQYIGVQHVMDSRSLAFADTVRQRTDGQGVDIVLNSLPGAYVPKSLALLRDYGRFLEIGKTDVYQHRHLDLYPFHKNLSYHTIDMDRVCRERPGLIRALLLELMAGFTDTTLKPLPRSVFSLQDARSAFRHMVQRRHLGKVVLSMPDQATTPEASFPIRADGSYLITGGLGALGFRVAQWLVRHGVRHLALMGRSPASSPQHTALETMRAAGVQIVVVPADVAQEEQLAHGLEQISATMPPLRGIIHAAGVLDDSPLHTMEQESLTGVLAPKVAGAWHLHTVTSDLGLDFFVLFSSLASVLGSPGQGNYAAANAFLDALAHYRRSVGLPALVINWGPWAEAGMAALPARRRHLSRRGLQPLAPEAALGVLERLLQQDAVQVAVASVDWQQLSRSTGVPHHSRLFADLLREETHGASDIAAEPQDGELTRARLLALEPAQRHAVLLAHLQHELGLVMGIPRAEVDPEVSLNNLGLDSLMAMELKSSVESRLRVTMPMESFADDPCLVDLVGRVLARVPDSPADPEPLSR